MDAQLKPIIIAKCVPKNACPRAVAVTLCGGPRYTSLVQGMEMVRELGTDLQLMYTLCKNARRYLGKAEEVTIVMP